MIHDLPTLGDLTVLCGSTVHQAVEVINNNGLRTCFVVDGNGVLLGVITDGDIRRSLLGGLVLSELVETIMSSDYVSVELGAPVQQIQKHLESIDIIPIKDPDGLVVDFACHERFFQIPLTEPSFDGNELEYVTDCILSGWISSQGSYVKKFEEQFQEYVSGNYALAVSSGTAALHLALRMHGVGAGDEVIVPNLTFAATANAALYVGATPVFVDVDPDTWTIDVSELKELIGPRTRAVIPVHLYGMPAEMSQLMDVAREADLKVVEDCAEAFGSLYDGRHVGTFGDSGIFSFFGNKTITTGEGGMLIVKESDDLGLATLLRDHGMSPKKRYWHDLVGYNYRMSNLQAAVGVAQLERADLIVSEKIRIGDMYTSLLSGSECLTLPAQRSECRNSYWFYTVVLDNEISEYRDKIINGLRSHGIETRPTFVPLHRMPVYQDYRRPSQRFPVSEHIGDAGISLPSGIKMTERDVARVAEALLDEICKYV